MKETHASPMSFVGSTRRLTAWAKHSASLDRVMRWIGVILALPFVWAFLIVWYVVVFGLFGLVTIPFRFFRRSQRKSLALQQASLDAQKAQLEAIQKLQVPQP